MSKVSIVGGQIPESIPRLVLRLKRRSGSLIADVVLEPIRRFQSSEGLAREAAFVAGEG